MPVAVWSDTYVTGIEDIDAQHKGLFEAINHLADCFHTGRAAEGALEALDFLAEYTKEHFETEEEFMRVMAYPRLSLHESEHTVLLTKVLNLQVKLDEGFLITADVASFVADWLAHHINESDMDYVRFFQARTAHLQ